MAEPKLEVTSPTTYYESIVLLIGVLSIFLEQLGNSALVAILSANLGLNLPGILTSDA